MNLGLEALNMSEILMGFSSPFRHIFGKEQIEINIYGQGM
jgi:hypothetical protein